MEADEQGHRDVAETSDELFDRTVLEDLERVQAAVGVGAAPANGRLLRTYLDRRSPWGRVLRWMFGLLAVAAVGHELYAGHHDRKMSKAIQTVAAQPDLEVRCRRYWDELFGFRPNPGYVEWGSNTANLQLNVCSDAAAFAEDPGDDDHRVGIMVLSHELAHLVGHYDESTTECVAMWILPRTAVALGATSAEGSTAASWYARNYNPLLRADYNAPGCLSGSPPSSPLLR